MQSPLRAIDANLNRAREALRVLEDAMRFGADDPHATRAIKNLRHGVQQIAATIGEARLLAARDVAADVGRDVKTDSEQTRADLDDILAAAFGRLAEALRSIGEFAKLVAPEAAVIAERMRYEGYALEPLLRLRGPLRERLRKARLYVIITEQVCRDGDWRAAADAALRGGAGCMQLREKSLPDSELLERARQLRVVTRAHRALFCVNDRPDVAVLAEADLVHVGKDDLSIAETRRIFGGGRLIGVSTHSQDQFEAALAQEPDYIAIGPMFPTTTKPQAHIAGLATLARVRGSTTLPLVAIGGINVDNAASVRAAGADVLCVCSAVVAAAEVERGAAELRAIMDR